MKIDFKDEIIGFLKNHKNQKFSTNALAKWFVENYPEEAKRKGEASKNKKMLNATTPEEKHKAIIGIYAGEISSTKLSIESKKEYDIKIDTKPKMKFYYTQNPHYQSNNEQTTEFKIELDKKDKTLEKDVGEALAIYLQNTLKIHSQPINHSTSSNKQEAGSNTWLHPDWAGMEELNNKWSRIIKKCAKHLAGQQARLWSFEVKTEITRSNLRESFFQALSNSSWAHYGYLVAADLVEGRQNDTRHELEMLSTRHGIGFILLNKKEPENSNILIPAKEKSEVDWNIANRLAEENKDFESYLNKFDTFYKKQNASDIIWFDPDPYFKKYKEQKLRNKKKK